MPKTFKCPSCTAPLEVASATIESVRCSYCNSSVLLHDFTGSGMDWDVETGEPPSVDELLLVRRIGDILRRGNKIQAIKVYRLAFGTGLKDAKDAVERIERGERVVFTENVHVVDATKLREALADAARTLEENLPSASSAGWFLVAVAAVVFLVIGGAAAGVILMLRSAPARSAPPINAPGVSEEAPVLEDGKLRSTNPAVADVVLDFGTEGIGAGQFRDARAVAVDRDGRIYAADYTGGRVQMFDPAGNFILQWSMNPAKPLHRIASDGSRVFVLQAGKVSSFEGGTGKPAAGGVFEKAEWIDDLAFGLDGSVTVVGNNESVRRFAPDGSRVFELASAISSIADSTEPSIKAAVDGNGDLYLLGAFSRSVFRFSAGGKFLNRIGSGGNAPGQLRAPHDVAVDGQGRVYVSDSGGIVVFAGDGRYLHTFSAGNTLAFGLAFDSKGDLYAASRTRIVKFRLK